MSPFNFKFTEVLVNYKQLTTILSQLIYHSYIIDYATFKKR